MNEKESMSTPQLTVEQLKRCEENRKRALEIRARKAKETLTASGNIKASPIINKPSVVPVNTSEFTNPKFSVAPEVRDKSCVTNPCKAVYYSQEKQVVGTCLMITRHRFMVEMEYHQPSIEIFKRISSRCYDAVSKRWSFDIKDHDRLISDVKEVPSAIIGALPKFIYDHFRNAPQNKTINEADLSKLDTTLVEALMPFQKTGISFGIMNGGRVIIADDMGLGKTIQAIGIASYYMSEWPLLVVTPSSVRYMWEEAFHTWLPSIHPSDINIVNTQKDKTEFGRIVILSYDMLSKRQKDIQRRNFKVLVFDESHFLKNIKSARTKAAELIVKKASRVILLSGTPALSRPIELYTQINFVKPKLFPSYSVFGLRYCSGKQMPWGMDYSGSSNMTELQLVLEETVLIRRLKSEVITELPAKQRQMIILETSQIQDHKNMQNISQEMSKTSLVGMERRSMLLQFFHLTGVAKIRAVCNYIEELLEADKKFICFGHHQQVLDAICDLLYRKNCSFIRIDGSTSAENRKASCDKFQFSDMCKVAVLSITAANAGINLTAAQLVVFAELFWNPGILTQAEDRAHRIGQEDCVIVQYLVARGTADDHIWPMIQKKLNTLSKAGLNKDNFTNADTVCASLSASPDTGQQTTIDTFFEKLDEEILWDNVSDEIFEKLEEKKIKLS